MISLIEPYVEEPETRDSYEVLVIMGVLAWNLAVVPESARSALAEDLLRDAATSGLPLTRAVLSNLLERKLELFPADLRFIEKFDVRQEGQRFTVLLTTSQVEIGG